MDEAMIEKWNSVVREDDTVFHLGDFCLGRKMGYADNYFRKLNGKVYIAQGNHDAWMKDAAFFPNTKNSYVQRIEQQYELNISGRKIILSHYPMRSWNHSHYGSYHLYGHVHGNLPDFGLSIDVGVDTNNFTPYSFEQIEYIMETKKLTQKDYEIFSK